MYTSFFGLNEKPFAITPDPRYLYLSERHTEALAHLAYGISEAGGFIQLTGEVGTGKTTVLRSLLLQLPPHCDVALILNPRVTPAEFLLAICDELHVKVPQGAAGSVKALVDLLTHYLLDAHGRNRRIVLMVDEAQNLDADVLEQVRLLTNLETETQKLLQIILIGQPELREVLARPELRQLAQRITGRYHLEALRKSETIAYLRHRARVAGATRDLFTGAAPRELHRLSGGVPRIINVIADRALLGAYTLEEPVVNGALVRRAASEVYGRPVLAPWVRWLAIGGTVAGALLLGFVLWQAWPARGSGDAPVAIADAAVEPSAKPAPAPAAREPLATKLARSAASTTPDAAFGSLFSLWGAEFQPGQGIACDQAMAQGLACVWQRGSLAQLKLINRPAILSLVDGDGNTHQVVLSSLDRDGAKLLLGGDETRSPVEELSDYWFGEFLVLWRPQAAGPRPLRAGMRGDDVLWLRQSLEQVAGLPSSPDGDVFDASLQQLVESFQRSRRLAVDGVAGLQTQLVLDAALGRPGTPTLSQSGPQAGA
jgi:general secretion pathway protein A